MTSYARTASLPFDHLLAELTAFPIVSEAALTNPITHLDPNMDPATAGLWRAAEAELLSAAPAMSLDELVAMRDGAWFGGFNNGPRSLQKHLRCVTELYVEERGGVVVPRLPYPSSGPMAATPMHAHARRSWMWLTFALPADLLLATKAVRGWIPEPDLFTPAVRDLLTQGFAETHLHVGAALDFGTLWALLVARLSDPGLKLGELAAPGAVLAEGNEFTLWLIRAAIARALLGGFLASNHPGPFLSYLRDLRTHVVRHAGAVNFALAQSALSDLAYGTISKVPVAQLQGAYAALVGTSGERMARKLSSALTLDPLARVLGDGRRSTEQIYVHEACEYLDARENAGRPDQVAAQLFWQTVRVRTMVYRHLTQRPLTPGLPWFMRFYDRMVKTRGNVTEELLVEAAARTCGGDTGLTSLEMRASPSADIKDLVCWVRTLSKAGPRPALTVAQDNTRPAAPDAQDDTPPAVARTDRPGAELAMVFHFLKQRGGEAKPGVPRVAGEGANADPDPNHNVNASGFRFGWYYSEQRRAASALARLLHQLPLAQFLVRGLDVCADELGVPMWVLRPLVMHVRRAATEGAQYLRAFRGPQPDPLRTTVHAGEDFAHLLTGLRSIHEAVELLELREGDRLGHAVALGVEPHRWAQRAGRVAMPLQDRIMDLTWEWTWWTQRGQGADAARLAYVDREISMLGWEWFGRSINPLHIERLRHDLCDHAMLRATGFPDGVTTRPRDTDGRDDTDDRDRDRANGNGNGRDRPPGQDSLSRRRRRLVDYLTDRHVFRRGRRILWVDPTAEAGALAEIQTSLRAEIGRRGLAIELNPTSNLLIADLGDLRNHPLWRLSPPLPVEGLPPLAVTVGSDDPLVFNSNLAGEYQLLFDSLVLAGLTDSQALDWLDKVRRTGLERRFSMPPQPARNVFDVVNPNNLTPLD
ncbi:hypothetical protein AB0I81_12230 [Nonomuraea sp. NPDC050404]|uniref:hypothetical protein n=1 Tax=Nonomuraea sp. NPDC050404 TaxID=3155783 RepID=UPI00340B9591